MLATLTCTRNIVSARIHSLCKRINDNFSQQDDSHLNGKRSLVCYEFIINASVLFRKQSSPELTEVTLRINEIYPAFHLVARPDKTSWERQYT